jgi:hypothetical protein
MNNCIQSSPAFNWTAFAGVATFLAVLVALIPHYQNMFRSRKRRILTIAKIRLILEDLMFLTDTTESLKLPFLERFHNELDTVASSSIYELQLKNHEKLLKLLYLMRIYDENEEALDSLQKCVIEVHMDFARMDKSDVSK